MMRLPALPLALVLAFPASAAAEPTLQPLKPCYVSVSYDEDTQMHTAEYADVRGNGFTPGADVTILVDGTTAGTTTAGSFGEIVARVQAPRQDSGEREFSITAVEPGGASATALSRVARLAVGAKPRTASPRQRVIWHGRGFTDLSKPIFAHYYRKGRLRKTVRIGVPKGACGSFAVRRRQFPFKRPRLGLWHVRFDQEREFDFDAETTLFDIRIRVRERFRRGR